MLRSQGQLAAFTERAAWQTGCLFLSTAAGRRCTAVHASVLGAPLRAWRTFTTPALH